MQEVSKMMIDAKQYSGTQINELAANAHDAVIISDCCSQRYLGCGLDHQTLIIDGTPGNDLGALMNGARIILHGNAQEGLGNTMNDGEIIIHGHCGDTCAYSMRGGKIYIRDSVGVRCGIHMKEHDTKKPILIIGESAGEFLGEYMSGGLIVILNRLNEFEPLPASTAVGQHGGLILVRVADIDHNKYENLAKKEDIKLIEAYLHEFCEYFNEDVNMYLHSRYRVLKPAAKDPYADYYVKN